MRRSGQQFVTYNLEVMIESEGLGDPFFPHHLEAHCVSQAKAVIVIRCKPAGSVEKNRAAHRR